MIHVAFLGEAFQKRVTDNCDVIQVETSARGAWQSYVFLAVVLMLGPICKKKINIYICPSRWTHAHTLVYTGLHWSCECHFCTFFLFLFFLLPWRSRSLHPLSMRGAIFRWNVRNISSSGRWNDWNDQLQNSDVWMYILYIYIIMYMIYIYI